MTTHEAAAGLSSDADWTEPGVYPVAAGVHRIPLPLPMDGLRAVNVYIIETSNGLTCIDGGWAIEASRRQFQAALAALGHHPRDITSFLVTHVHRDHYTQAVALRREFGAAVVSLGIGDRGSLANVHEGVDGRVTVQRLLRAGAPALSAEWGLRYGLPQEDQSIWQDPDTWLEGDVDIPVGDRVLHAVETPGHTAGHLVFADLDAGTIFSGDHILPTITPSIGFEGVVVASPLADFLASLAKVRRLPDLALLPAHGATGMSSHDRIDQLLAHHEERLALSSAGVEAGCSTAHEVAAVLPWTRRHRAFANLDLLNQSLAALETMSHLDVLVARGQVRCELVDGEARYSAVSVPRGHDT